MRKYAGLVLAFAVAVSACGGSGAGSCEDVADRGVDLVQDLLDRLEDVTLDDVIAGGNDFALPGLDEFEEEAEALQEDANDLECSDDELNDLFNDRLDQLSASGEVAQLFLDGLRQEGLGFGE